MLVLYLRDFSSMIYTAEYFFDDVSQYPRLTNHIEIICVNRFTYCHCHAQLIQNSEYTN